MDSGKEEEGLVLGRQNSMYIMGTWDVTDEDTGTGRMCWSAWLERRAGAGYGEPCMTFLGVSTRFYSQEFQHERDTHQCFRKATFVAGRGSKKKIRQEVKGEKKSWTVSAGKQRADGLRGQQMNQQNLEESGCGMVVSLTPGYRNLVNVSEILQTSSVLGFPIEPFEELFKTPMPRPMDSEFLEVEAHGSVVPMCNQGQEPRSRQSYL